MKAKVTKWGNSYAIRIPLQVIEELDLSDESELLLETKDNGFTVTKPSKKKKLSDLLKNIKPQKEFDWGPPRGKEIW